jgi:hypothetical protein
MDAVRFENRLPMMDHRFHNRSAAEIAEMAFDAQQRMKSAKAEFDACRLKLIELAQGAKLSVRLADKCYVSISARPAISNKNSYIVNAEAFEQLKELTRQKLFDLGVIKLRKNADQPRSPTLRISPL